MLYDNMDLIVQKRRFVFYRCHKEDYIEHLVSEDGRISHVQKSQEGEFNMIQKKFNAK